MSQDVRADNLDDAWGNFDPEPLAGDSPFMSITKGGRLIGLNARCCAIPVRL